jgi:hypothetical protein
MVSPWGLAILQSWLQGREELNDQHVNWREASARREGARREDQRRAEMSAHIKISDLDLLEDTKCLYANRE